MPHLHVALDGSFMELTSTPPGFGLMRLGPEMDATLSSGGLVGFRFTAGTGQGPRLPRATPVICCAHSVPCSVAQHARRGRRARGGGGSRCISFPSFWGSARIQTDVSFLSVWRHLRSSIVGLGRRPWLSQAASCLPNCPVSGTEFLLYTALCKYGPAWPPETCRPLGRTIASGRSVAGPNLGPATAKAISTSAEKHGSHGRGVSSLESRRENLG